jgi:hypothetical protein
MKPSWKEKSDWDFLTDLLLQTRVPRLAIPNFQLGCGSPKPETLALPSFAYTTLE